MTNFLRRKSQIYSEIKRLLPEGVAPPAWRLSSIVQLEQQLNRLRNRSRMNIIQSELLQRSNTMRMRRYTTLDRTLTNGLREITYSHTVPESMRSRINENNVEDIREQLRIITETHRTSIGEHRFQIVIEDSRRTTQNLISTPFVEGISHSINQMFSLHINPYVRGRDSGQTENPFEIGKITIKILIPPDNSMGASSSRSIAQAHKSWLIINPKAKFNCVFQSVAVCRNFASSKSLLEMTDEGHNLRVRSGKDLKSEVKPTTDNFADNTTLQELSNYTRYPIKLYNNVFELIKEFKPVNPLRRYRGIKCYELQKCGDHCKALVRKTDILKKYQDFNFDEHILKDLENQKSSDKDVLLPKKKYFHNYNHKIASWDIETSNDKHGRHIPYACSIAWFEYEYGVPHKQTIRNRKIVNKKVVYINKDIEIPNIINKSIREKQFWGLECLEDMTHWIYENKSIFNGYTLYAHNGGKYDLPLVIKKAFIESEDFVIEGKGCVELNNAWIGFTLRARNDRKYKIYFRDSFRLLPMGLEKLTKELQVEHQKLTETVKHDQITLQNYRSFPQLPLYLTHDVFGLLEVIEKFGRNVYDELGIDITKCFTGASLSKINFFKNYYSSKVSVYTLSKDNDKFIRDSYFGGRVECFKMNNIGNSVNSTGAQGGGIYYYDFTSLYPDVGRKYLPCGEPENIPLNLATELPQDFFGWVECIVRTRNNLIPNSFVPKHSMLKDNRLIFPIFENWTKINLFSEELDFEQYEYQFVSGIKFKKDKFKKKFFNDGFINKAKAKSDGNPAMAQAYKIIINSGYGFWGLRTQDRDGVIICEPNSNVYLEFLNTNKLLSIGENNGYMFCRVLKDLEVKDFNVSVAAAISSYARSKLHSLLTAIKDVGGEVQYCDTDSVICNINLNDYPEIKKIFQWDGDGSELGSLKNECDEKVEGLLKKLFPDNKDKQKKIFDELVIKENGNLHFDEGIITGCKQYALRKLVVIEGKEYPLEIVKCKGYSQKDDKLTYEDMINLSKGKTKSQQQNQFRCPKSNYVKENNGFEIKTQKITKTFRKIYSKGTVDNNDISPLRI